MKKGIIGQFIEWRCEKSEYLDQVASIIRRLSRDGQLGMKELESHHGNEEVDDDYKNIASCCISIALLQKSLFDYLKKVRHDFCWKFHNRDLIADLSPKWDQPAWNLVITDCKTIEKRNGLL